MTAYRLAEFHPFETAGRRFLYLVPSGAIFEPGPAACAILDRLAAGERTRAELVAELGPEAEEALDELNQAHAVAAGDGFHDPIERMPLPFPLNTLS